MGSFRNRRSGQRPRDPSLTNESPRSLCEKTNERVGLTGVKQEGGPPLPFTVSDNTLLNERKEGTERKETGEFGVLIKPKKGSESQT